MANEEYQVLTEVGYGELGLDPDEVNKKLKEEELAKELREKQE